MLQMVEPGVFEPMDRDRRRHDGQSILTPYDIVAERAFRFHDMLRGDERAR